MIKDITSNEILLLAYNELPPGTHTTVLETVQNCKELKAEYDAIRASMDILDGAFTAPHPTSVAIINEEGCSSSSLEMC